MLVIMVPVGHCHDSLIMFESLLWMEAIRSHQVESMVGHIVCGYLQGIRIIPGFLNGGAEPGFRNHPQKKQRVHDTYLSCSVTLEKKGLEPFWGLGPFLVGAPKKELDK